MRQIAATTRPGQAVTEAGRHGDWKVIGQCVQVAVRRGRKRMREPFVKLVGRQAALSRGLAQTLDYLVTVAV